MGVIAGPKLEGQMGWLRVAALDLRLGLRDSPASKFILAWIWTRFRFVPTDVFDFDLGSDN